MDRELCRIECLKLAFQRRCAGQTLADLQADAEQIETWVKAATPPPGNQAGQPPRR